MKTYRYILLDWDGNLAKTLDIWLEACRQPLMKRGLHLSDEEISASFGAFTKYMTEWGIQDVEVVIEEADTFARGMLPDVELYPDALEVLETLHQKGKKLVLITTSPHRNIEHLLDKYNMNRLFDALVTHDNVSHHKPHPEPIEKALELLDGNKDEAVMIGDSDKDLGAAANAGIDSILFYPDEHKKFYKLDSLKAHNPTYIVDDFKKIIEIAG